MTFAAPPDERLFDRPRASPLAARGRFTAILLLCFLLHAMAISLFLHFDRSDDLARGEQEIPIEVIVEPPLPKEPEPPAPKSEQQPKQATLDEKMATDAPRPPNDEKVMKNAPDEASHSPKAAPEKSAEAKPTEASTPQLVDRRADGDPVKAAELQRPGALKQAVAQPETQQNTAQNPLAAFTATPDYSFAPASRQSPVAGGKAASTYLSILYGMVMARIHVPEAAAGRVQSLGKIAFSINFDGRLLQANVVQSSGSPEFDSAAMAAIRAAAPFPPSPTRTELSLVFKYGK